MTQIEVKQVGEKLFFEAEGQKWYIEHEAKVREADFVYSGGVVATAPTARDKQDLDCLDVVAINGSLCLTGNPQVYVSSVRYADGTNGLANGGFVQAYKVAE